MRAVCAISTLMSKGHLIAEPRAAQDSFCFPFPYEANGELVAQTCLKGLGRGIQFALAAFEDRFEGQRYQSTTVPALVEKLTSTTSGDGDANSKTLSSRGTAWPFASIVLIVLGDIPNQH
jgi:hypothetical protein